MQAARGVVVAGCLGACVAILVPACGEMLPLGPSADAGLSDVANDAVACPAESCAERLRCELFDFENGCADWTPSGDATGVTRECVGGKLHIVAEGTLDAAMSIERDAPSTASLVRIAARMAIHRWDGGRVLRVSIGGAIAFEIRAESVIGDAVELRLCALAGACEVTVLSVAAASEHLFVAEIGATSTTLTMDCAPFASVKTSSLELDSSVKVEFGAPIGGDPAEGTLDDVVIWFAEP